MQKSETIKEIAKALITFHMKVENIKKDSKNPFFKSSYASLSTILESISVPLAESGLSFVQFPVEDNGLTTILMHADSGEYLQANYIMQPVKNDPQGKGSSLTYQRRYSISSILGLNILDDDDANTATFGGKTPQDAIDNNKAWLNENMPEFKSAVEKIKAGKSSIKALREYFKISKQIEEKINEAVAV